MLWLVCKSIFSSIMHLVQLPAADNLPTPRYGSKHRSSIRQREGLPTIEIKETTFFICWKFTICGYELGQMSSAKIDFIVRICHVAAWQEDGAPAILEYRFRNAKIIPILKKWSSPQAFIIGNHLVRDILPFLILLWRQNIFSTCDPDGRSFTCP